MKNLTLILSLVFFSFAVDAQTSASFSAPQFLTLEGDTLGLSNANTVVLPGVENYTEFYPNFANDTIQIASNNGLLPLNLDDLEVFVGGPNWNRGQDYTVDTIGVPNQIFLWRDLESEHLKIKFKISN